MTDRFGALPIEAENLFDVVKIRNLGERLGFEKIIIKNGMMQTTRGKIVAVILLSLFAVAVVVLAVLTAKVPEFGAALSDFFGKIYKPIKEFFSNLFGPRS